MTMSAATAASSAARASFAFLAEVLSKYGRRDFAVRAWDGSVWEPDARQPARFTRCFGQTVYSSITASP
ncbi:MAG TPA: hypothetical protein VMG10_34550 [Gemmataceae bacterium]|nr:hypothetical protein [Gemmataceae bacterium]